MQESEANMRRNEEYKQTSNDSVWRKLRKYSLAKTGAIHCERCGYHDTENAWGIRNPWRSWKEHRNRQYREV